jgi:hypothetical protein
VRLGEKSMRYEFTVRSGSSVAASGSMVVAFAALGPPHAAPWPEDVRAALGGGLARPLRMEFRRRDPRRCHGPRREWIRALETRVSTHCPPSLRSVDRFADHAVLNGSLATLPNDPRQPAAGAGSKSS